jgi:hypothetical protein
MENPEYNYFLEIGLLIIVAIGYIFRGLFSAAGKDLWDYIKENTANLRRVSMEVPHDFKAVIYPIQNCTWISEENIKNKEKHKWKYYPHPKSGGKCFRTLNKGNVVLKEYFMITPDAKKV